MLQPAINTTDVLQNIGYRRSWDTFTGFIVERLNFQIIRVSFRFIQHSDIPVFKLVLMALSAAQLFIVHQLVDEALSKFSLFFTLSLARRFWRKIMEKHQIIAAKRLLSTDNLLNR